MYFDTVLEMGQRNAAMACSRSTKAVVYMHQQEGYLGTSYLDDLISVASVATTVTKMLDTRGPGVPTGGGLD